MAVSDNLRTAKRDFDAFVTWIMETLASLTPAQQVLAICVFCLALFWLTVLRPGEYRKDDKESMGREFNMALVVVMIFGLGVGYLLTPNLSKLGTLI